MKGNLKSFVEAKKRYEGCKYETKNYGTVKVIEYKSTKNVVVQFENTGYLTSTTIGSLNKGLVKDKFAPTVCGFGIVGDSKIRCDDGSIEKEYRRWEYMLNRVYGRPTKTYIDCEVSFEFKKYEDFKSWCSKQIGFDREGWQLDKDVLFKGNKIYSPETCCFVPSEINNIFIKQQNIRGEFPIGVWFDKRSVKYQADVCTGGNTRKRLGYFDSPEDAFYAYKKAKEDYIKEVAKKWKDQIDTRVYDALMDYEVNLDD